MYALYARQSRDKKDSISIESQFNFCMKEVPEGIKVKKYKDKGWSGKNIERPDFQRLLKDIEQGKIKKVIVYRLDRMSRSTLDFAQLIEVFNKYNVEFVSTTEKFDTSTPIGNAMLSIIMVFAELERSTIMQRITDNYYQRGKKGMHLGGNVPFGFNLSKNNIVNGLKTSIYEQNNDMKLIERIFNEYAYENKALGRIAKDFNWEGIKTAQNSDWTNATIRRILKNPAYVMADIDIYNYFKNNGCIIHNDIEDFIGNGLYLYGKGDKLQDLDGFNIVIAPHEGVIDSKTWLKCQYKLSENRQIKNKFKGKYSWLSGLVKCSKCESAMVVVKAKLSEKHNTFATYLSCSKRRNKLMCTARSVRVEDAELKVEKEMFKYIKTLDNKLKIEKLEETKKSNELKTLIASKENEIENLVDNMAAAKGATMKYINKRLDKLDKELSELQEEYKKETKLNLQKDISLENFEELFSAWEDMSVEDKREVAKTIIDKIYIDENIVKIEWKY